MSDAANSSGVKGGESPVVPSSPIASASPMLESTSFSLADRVMRRLIAIEKKVADLKPSFWRIAIADSLKIAITVAGTLWATYMAGKLSQENILVAAAANVEAAERMKDFREVRREWAAAKSTFQNYFVAAEHSPQLLPPALDFVKVDLNLLRQIETALIPSILAKKLDEFRNAAETGKIQCEDTKSPDERKARAKATRVLLDQKSIEINAAFDQALLDRNRIR